jgi:NAD(P)-dependent dehydrogenase (short-subunit alcohol dehydrogenase family)
MQIFDLAEKVLVVTGATGVLAGSAARYLAGWRAHIVCIGRRIDRVNALVEEIQSAGGQASGWPCDVTKQDELQSVCDEVISNCGRIDGLVNGAGGNRQGAIVQPSDSLFDLDLAAYGDVIDLNLIGTLLPSLVFGKAMVAWGAGSIVNFSSATSERAVTRVLGYSNAKAAVDNLTRWMATHFALEFSDAVRVNAVCPGFFVGDQNRDLLLNADGSLTTRGEKIISHTPMKRFGEPAEICGAIHFLLSDAAKFVTGQVIHVDGGFGIFSGV